MRVPALTLRRERRCTVNFRRLVLQELDLLEHWWRHAYAAASSIGLLKRGRCELTRRVGLLKRRECCLSCRR